VAPDDAATLPALSVVPVRERKRLLDEVTVWIVVGVSVAVAGSWFLRGLPIDIGLAARAAFGFTLLYIIAATLADRLHRPRALVAALLLLQGSGIAFLGLFWHLAGGLQNPMFLLAFALPVIASGIVLWRWQALVAALLSITTVAFVALVESAELRWYLFQLGTPIDRFLRWLPVVSGRLEPLPGFTPRPSYLIVVLVVFVVLQLLCALLTEFLGQTLRRWHGRLASVAADANGAANGLFPAALKAAPTPAVLVLPDNGQILLASDGFVKRMLLHGENLAGKALFDLIRFVEPDRVRSLLQAGGGDLPFCLYHIGPEARVARLHVYAFRCHGSTYAYVSFGDQTDLFYLHTAFQTIDEPMLVLGADDRLRYANRAAEELFGELYFGMDVQAALNGAGLPERWWMAPLSPGRTRRLRIGTAVYDVSCAGTQASKDAEAMSILRLSPVAVETAADQA
jgi:PAS domain-containing protein